jgi:hypothetical protein
VKVIDSTFSTGAIGLRKKTSVRARSVEVDIQKGFGAKFAGASTLASLFFKEMSPAGNSPRRGGLVCESIGDREHERSFVPRSFCDSLHTGY